MWRVQIRKGGQSHSATFPNKVQAQEWATNTEAEIYAGRLGKVPSGKTFGDLIDRYIKDVTPTKRGERSERLRLERIKRDEIASVKLEDLSPDHIAGWRDRRLRQVSGASVLREITTISHACTVAMKEWRWLRENPVKDVRKPPEAPPRQRVFTQDEIARILQVCGCDYSSKTGRVGAALEYALETAMRAGEICALTWGNVFDNHVHLPKTKNGLPRDVPLSARAREITNLLRNAVANEKECLVFDISPAVLDALFRKVKAKALVEGCTFHDSRRTALTRLAKVFPNVLDLARVSGHRDLKILSSVYYSPSIEDLSQQICR